MKKVLLSLFAIACISTASFAQGRFSVGAELALPSGDWSKIVGIGFGGSLRYESPINDNLSWTASAGFLTWGEKDKSGITFTAIPVLGGIKYYFTESFNGFYAGAEAGVSFDKAKIEGLGSVSDTEFAFGPQVGYHLGSLDLSARYFMLPDAASIGVRVAYVLGGK